MRANGASVTVLRVYQLLDEREVRALVETERHAGIWHLRGVSAVRKT